MEGCPLAHEKFQGNCVNCPQVTDCVFLRLMKGMADVKMQLRDICKQLNALKSA
jgi:hypothetical protein